MTGSSREVDKLILVGVHDISWEAEKQSDREVGHDTSQG